MHPPLGGEGLDVGIQDAFNLGRKLAAESRAVDGDHHSLSGQLNGDGSQCVGAVGADDEVGEAEFLASPLDFLSCRARVVGEDGQRGGGGKRGRVGVGRGHERCDRTADDRDVERELHVPLGTEVSGEPGDFGTGFIWPVTKVTVSATSAASAWAFGPRTAITTGVYRSGPSSCRSAATVSRTRATRSPGATAGRPSSRSWSSSPGRPVPMPISKRPSLSTDSECASHAVVQAGRTGQAYTQVPTRIPARPAARASIGPGAGCHGGTSGMSSVE